LGKKKGADLYLGDAYNEQCCGGTKGAGEGCPGENKWLILITSPPGSPKLQRMKKEGKKNLK